MLLSFPFHCTKRLFSSSKSIILISKQTHWKSCHVPTSWHDRTIAHNHRRRKADYWKKEKKSKIKINTNRMESSQRWGGEVSDGAVLFSARLECIIWALHGIDPEHPPLSLGFSSCSNWGITPGGSAWLGTIGIYLLLICGIKEANPWQKADTHSEDRWMISASNGGEWLAVRIVPERKTCGSPPPILWTVCQNC